MPKSLNDILKGVKKSTINKLTTGDVPGVDYADKMQDGRDFVAQHSVEKHEDRVGNDDKVYKGGTKKAEMERHGHEPKPKDVQVYKKNQQVGEETDSFNSGTRSPEEGSISLDEIKKPLANYIKKRSEELKGFGDEESIRRYNKKGVTVGDQLGKDVKANSNKFIAKAKSKLGEAKDEREYGYEGDMAITQLKTICRNSEHLMKMLKPDTDLPEWVQSKITKAEDYISTAHDYLMSEMNEAYKCNMSEAGKMCEVHGNKACPKEDNDSAENKEPKYTGKKDKQGKQLITDKKLEEKLTKDMSAGEVIKDFEKSDDPRFKGDSKDKRKKRALAAYYGMQKESLSDQRSSKATASEKAREKIHGALMKAKEKMKEQAAPVETPITFPVTNSREGFRV